MKTPTLRLLSSGLAGVCAAAALLVANACLYAAPGDGFLPTIPSHVVPASPAPPGMVWIPGGEFSMGANGCADGTLCGITSALDSLPIHRVALDGFWMDGTEVTNAEYARFAEATGYVTVAERTPSKSDLPGVPDDLLVPGSIVFSPPLDTADINDITQRWKYVKGANWRHPRGVGDQAKPDEPVVQVAYEDAEKYAAWAGKRLPTEAEWEFGARGGLAGKLYPWGDDFRPGGKHLANTYQGNFPSRDTGEDGFAGIAPVKSFPPNGYGLYEMSGNVWEWCSDWYRPDAYAGIAATAGIVRNPVGPADSFDPSEPGAAKRAQRGGSFLCTDQYCSRYIIGTRGKGEVSTGSNHVGFRCVRSQPAPPSAQR